MMDFITSHGLDIFTTVLGLVYILLEYRASIWLWVVGIIMPALDIWLYWSHGLYGDAGMAVYYTLAAVYGYAVWKWGKNSEAKELPITYMKKSLYLPTLVCFLLAWAATYYILVTFTNSTVPLQDSFTNALSFVGVGSQIHRAMVLLDYRRCRLLLPLRGKRNSFQGIALRTLRGHRYRWI